jgi:hypothetical protein
LTAKKWGDYEMRSTEKRALPVLLRVFDNAPNKKEGDRNNVEEKVG